MIYNISSSKKKPSHKAKSAKEWKQRLILFAAGEKFHRGERPAKESEWERIIQRIESCPAHGDVSKACHCSYHQSVSICQKDM